MSTTTVIIADDHAVFRDGLKTILQNEPDIKVIDEAENGKQLLDKVIKLVPDVVLTDIKMPIVDGITAAKAINASLPQVHIIALSMYNEESLVVDMLESGATGYLLKNSDKTEIIDAIYAVAAGNSYYCKTTSRQLVELISSRQYRGANSKIKKSGLTPKEIEIMRMICEDFTSREIGEQVGQSYRTIEGYRSRIMDKIKVTGTAGIVVYAIKNGIFKLHK